MIDASVSLLAIAECSVTESAELLKTRLKSYTGLHVLTCIVSKIHMLILSIPSGATNTITRAELAAIVDLTTKDQRQRKGNAKEAQS